MHFPAEVRARIIQLRIAIAISLAITLLVFSYSLFQFPIGNHDWPRMYGIDPLDQFRSGRWFSSVIFSLTWYKQLPVINLLLSLFIQVVCGIFAVLLIEINFKQRFSNTQYVVSALLVSLIPFVTAHHYYTFEAYVFSAAQLLAISSLLIVSIWKSRVSVIIAVIVFSLSMATYQSSLNTASVLILGVILVRLIRLFEGEALHEAVRQISAMLVVFVFGAITYKASLLLFEAMGLLSSDSEQLSQIAIVELPSRIIDIAMASIRQLIVPQPYFPSTLKLGLLAIAITGGVSILRSLHLHTTRKAFTLQAALITAFSFLLLFATKTQFLISNNSDYYAYRFAAFGLSYFYMFFVLMALGVGGRGAFQSKPFVFGIIVVLYGFSLNNLMLQRDLVKQNEHDFRFFNRVFARIESDEKFTASKTYTLVQVGDYGNIKQYYGGYSDNHYRSHFHNFTTNATWNAASMFQKMEPTLKIEKNYSIENWDSYSNTEDMELMNSVMRFVDKTQPWPNKDSVKILDGNVIVVILTKSDQTLEKLERWKLQR